MVSTELLLVPCPFRSSISLLFSWSGGVLIFGSINDSFIVKYDLAKAICMVIDLIVAGMAFWYFQKSGHHVRGLSAPFAAASVPMAAIGGFF